MSNQGISIIKEFQVFKELCLAFSAFTKNLHRSLVLTLEEMKVLTFLQSTCEDSVATQRPQGQWPSTGPAVLTAIPAPGESVVHGQFPHACDSGLRSHPQPEGHPAPHGATGTEHQGRAPEDTAFPAKSPTATFQRKGLVSLLGFPFPNWKTGQSGRPG